MSKLHDHDKYLMSVDEFHSFCFSGSANFTMVNSETGNHIAYFIRARKIKKGQDPETRFFNVIVKAIGDGIPGRVEVGEIDRKKGIINVKEGIKSDYIGLTTIKWLLTNWRNLEKWNGKLKIYHHNICCSCGRDLEIEDSIQNGIGPICITSKMRRTLKMMEDLGLILQEGADYLQPANYDCAVAFAVEKFPDHLDRFFIPARLRKNNDFIKQLYEFDKYGLW